MRKSKKIINNPNQLSLFDNITENNTVQWNENLSNQIDNFANHESIDKNWNNFLKTQNINQNEQRNSDTNSRQQREPIHAPVQRGHNPEIGNRRDWNQDIRPDERYSTGEISTNETGRNLSSLPTESNGEIQRTSGFNSLGGQRERELSNRPDENTRSANNLLESDGGRLRTELVNFSSFTAPNNYASFSKKQRYNDNLSALDVLIEIEKQHRPATAAEQEILAKYVGWGGLKEILLNPDNSNEWKIDADIALKDSVKSVYDKFNVLDPDGSQGLLNAAKRSILNAHYTSYPIINAIYHAVEKAGFKNGNILEPAAGIGNFLAAMPDKMADNSNVTAIEMDRTSGKILQKLFPTASTHVSPFEQINLPENNFDLIISNIPFGDIQVYDKQLAIQKDNRFHDAAANIHNYYFAKSMLLAKPGSMIAFITSRYTMDSSKNKNIRELMQDNCEFCGAIRLPDNAFKANAGTSVVADVIFLRKFDIGEDKKQKHDFVNVKSVPFTDHTGQSGLISYNEYFHNNPAMMLGSVEYGGLYRNDEFNLKGDKINNQTDESGISVIQKQIENAADKIFPQEVIKKSKTVVDDTTGIDANVERYIRQAEFDDIGNIMTFKDGFIGKISERFHVNEELDKKVRNAGINPETIRHFPDKLTYKEIEEMQRLGIDIKDFQLRIVDELRVKKDDRPKVALIQQMRTFGKELIAKELAGYTDFQVDSVREKLKNVYDDFVFKFGEINHVKNKKIIADDVADASLLRSLERFDKEKNIFTPADILFQRTIKPNREIHATDNVEDAVALSLQKHGKVNMNYISELMNKPFSEIMDMQKGADTFIFQDIDGSYIDREEYLSGNVVEKLKIAKSFAEENPHFENNVRQLELVQPAPVPAVDIYSPLHAGWIPENYKNQFIEHLLKTSKFQLKYSLSEDAFHLNIQDWSPHIHSFATARRKPHWVIAHALNGIEPKVTYIVEKEDGKKKTEVDADDTQLAKSIYREIKAEWDDWKFIDQERRNHLSQIYNDKFNTTVLRKYDGSKLQLPGMIGYQPRPHQKDAIFRNIQQMGGINDHRVGAGKTLVQIATAMELRRLGMANKPVIIGLKSQIPQLYNEFKKMYPLAKVLFPTEKDFEATNRKRLLNNIATNDWDCIILSHDQFSKIKQPADIEAAMIEELNEVIVQEMAVTEDKRELYQLEKRLAKNEQKINELLDTSKDADVLSFDKLGVDFLMVDESQEFKNLEFTTVKKNIRGLGNPNGSKRAFNMLVAARHLQRVHGGDKGILFASGTPISNSMAELYLLFKYLRPNKMQQLGINSFDKWAGNFANDYSDLEFYMGKFKEVHRFREFANLPELLTLYREIADVRNDSNIHLEKPEINHELIKIQPSQVQLKLIEKLQKYIDTKGNEYALDLGLTAGYDERKGVNPSFALLAQNFAKKLSLDPRLIDPRFEPGSKLSEAAENIAKLFVQSASFKGTQLVFSDIGTPKSNNNIENLYEYLSGDINQADLDEIFGQDFYEKQSKPKLDVVLNRMTDVLNLNEDIEENVPNFDKLDEAKKLLREANQMENFNVYDELKNLLIQKGIPENQIAFIHDFKNRAQKEQLYEKVNKGEIRILLGSTKKLGTGVNVQERCIAGHHLDINWRPSDIEQRNGRFERQGNIGAKVFWDNKVESFYYATERTLDASMYNTVSQKAKFIAQMKVTTNSDLRTVKDIQEDVDMGSMAAELSGDPVFKEKASLTKRIAELQQLERSFKAKQYDLQNRMQANIKLIPLMQNKINNLAAAMPLFNAIPKNEDDEKVFSATINGRHIEKVSDFAQALLMEAEIAKKTKVADKQFLLGDMWGFKIMGVVKHDYFAEKKVVMQSIYDNNFNQLSEEKEIPAGEMAAGLQVKNIIQNIPEEINRLTNKISDLQSDIQSFENKLQSGFPFKDELRDSLNRLSEVDRIILERDKENKPDIAESENYDMENDIINEPVAVYKTKR